MTPISDIARANELLALGFDDDLNRRFAIQPGEATDYHRSAMGIDLSGIFCIEHERTLSINWTLSFESRLYQLAPLSRNFSPAKRKVLVRRYLDGSLHMFYRGEEIDFEEFDPQAMGRARQPKTPRRERSLAASGKPSLSSPNHPWKTAWRAKQLMQQ